jgi:tRNA pseudouridine38-40 synthase
VRTGQGELEAVLKRLIGHRVVVRAAGRTDAGVHALAQVVSFEVPERWTPEELQRALRALLPDDMWVLKVGRSPDGFDARRHAISRVYRYLVGCDAAASSPFRRPYEWALGRPLNCELLHDACAPITGEHDFQGFCAAGQDKPHYLCAVTNAEWRERVNGEGFIFEIEANRFLHNMVRFLVGTMVDVGRERRPVHDVSRILAEKDNKNASPPAPPEGLYLLGARYPQIDEVIDS